MGRNARCLTPELFNYMEVFYNQRRRPRAKSSPAAFERYAMTQTG